MNLTQNFISEASEIYKVEFLLDFGIEIEF